jgi:soluble lytic murein transglycosylase-like protein
MGYNIKIPAIAETAPNAGPGVTYKMAVIADIKFLKKNFSQYFNAASQYSGVPQTILYGFAAVESGSLGAKAISPAGAIGVMQESPATCYDTLARQLAAFNDDNGLACAELLNTLAPNVFIKMREPASKKASLYYRLLPYYGNQTAYRNALLNPYFNIITGAFTIAQLLMQSIASTGQPRLDHVIIKYNAGIGNFARLVTNRGLEKNTVDTAQLKANIPMAETKAYIVKMLGINGSMDVQKQKLA